MPDHLVPFRESHEKAIESLKQKSVKVLSSPFQPYSGSVFFLKCEADNPAETVEAFVKEDPYV